MSATEGTRRGAEDYTEQGWMVLYNTQASDSNSSVLSAGSISDCMDTQPTPPVMDPRYAESMHAQRCTGLKEWMKTFVKEMPAVPVDTLSNAQPDLAVTQHLVWDVQEINFAARTLTATATYSYRNKVLDCQETGVKGNNQLVLDVKKLNISSIKIDGKEVPFIIEEHHDRENPNKPDALHITIPSDRAVGDVVIEYTTDPKAPGIFWIDPQFTTGKKHPLMYTLFEPNAGAGVIPGQHSPQIRLSWKVNVATRSPDLIALSSVKNNPKARSVEGRYEGLYMDRKCPLYLLCLEVGHMEYAEYMDEEEKPTGYGVYTEQEAMEETKNAFKDIPGLIAAAEKLFGPYKWERYDASVLCDAFPYTAMEHGCKSTFGKSCTGQAEQIAHEIIHSWFGNDITNATWFEFFWNEGFTVWGQITVMTSYWDWDCASLVFWKMLKAMEKAIEEYQNTHPGLLSLVSKEAKFSRIPYGKGALFFFMLQDAMGGHDIFLQFVKDYRNVFFQNSMSSERFLAFLKAWLANESDVVNFEEFKANHKIDQWLYEREFPDNRPKVSSDCLELIQKQAEAFLEVGLMDLEAYHNWNEEMRYVFFGELEGKVTPEQLAYLDTQLSLSTSSSLCMREAWSQICAVTGYYTPATKECMINFVIDRNNMFMAHLISRELCKTSEGLSVVKEILKRGKAGKRLFGITREAVKKNLSQSAVSA